MRHIGGHMGSGAEGDASRGRAASPRMWRRLEGSLAYDSRERPLLTGVRAVATGFPRLLYRAPGYEIDLQIRPGLQGDRLRVLGQVLDEEFEPCSGCLLYTSPSPRDRQKSRMPSSA